MTVPPAPAPNAPTEPLLSVGGIVAGAVAIIGLIVAFGVDMSDDRQSAILAVVGVIAPFLVAALGRSRVFSPYTVRRMMHPEE